MSARAQCDTCGWTKQYDTPARAAFNSRRHVCKTDDNVRRATPQGGIVSGVRTGTRLEQLLQLQARLDNEIAAERLREARAGGLKVIPRSDMDGRRRANQATCEGYADRLAALGVTTWQVRSWAYAEGLVTSIKARGRLSTDVLDAYQAAHHPREQAPA